MSESSVWKDYFSYVSENNPHSAQKLNSDSNKNIYTTKIYDYKFLNNFLKEHNKPDIQNIDIDSRHPLFIGFVTSNPGIYSNIFCCGTTMENIHNKFATHGLAIEGCFHVEKISNNPHFLQGYQINSKDKLIFTEGIRLPYQTSFVIINDHQIVGFSNIDEIINSKPIGVNIQYIEGLMLMQQGKFFVEINEQIKHELVIEYPEIFDRSNGLLVLAFDKAGNIIIIYHNSISISDMKTLLETFKCHNAILLCTSSNAHIIWKVSGENTYNKSDFIGSPVDIVSNVLTFSS